MLYLLCRTTETTGQGEGDGVPQTLKSTREPIIGKKYTITKNIKMQRRKKYTEFFNTSKIKIKTLLTTDF